MQEYELPNMIRARRRQLGLSLRDLEAISGIARGRLSQIESGQRRPGLPTLQRLGTALHVSLADLSLASGLPAPALPTIQPYLRAAYGFTPETAADVERYLQEKYGAGGQPRDGEDELPEVHTQR